MEEFDRLVKQQLDTMDHLLFLQNEIERCLDLQKELNVLEQQTKILEIQDEIDIMRMELRSIQEIFERQTEEVIQSFRLTTV